MRRLQIAEQVALAKWDSGKDVEDVPREEQVVQAAVVRAAAKGLTNDQVSKFFRAQIEANRFVQYALLARWYREGKAPQHRPINLTEVIRPQLDELQNSLIDELARTESLRSRKTCRADIARAVGAYVSTHQGLSSPINSDTLYRALTGACIPEAAASKGP